MQDSLGDRMKKQYEDVTRWFLPRRTYTILRLDGKSFHRFTQNMYRPYDGRLMNWMDVSAHDLCKEIQGACFAYTQSDEISILLTDFEKPTTSAWFDGNLQKMVSVAASRLTAYFNSYSFSSTGQLACFDCRAFTIPDYVEVENYFIWRQKDAERNSIAMLAQSYASPKELHGKNLSQQHEIIHNAGDNWNNYPVRYRRGSISTRLATDLEPPIFTQDREYLKSKIPRHWEETTVPPFSQP